MRRFDAPHTRLVRRMRFLEIINLVVGGDGSRVINERIGHPTQRFDLRRLQNISKRSDRLTGVSS